jgi:uncharacterized protein involved in exopolysaccharide biosynthesis
MPALSDDLTSAAGDPAPGRSLSEHLAALKRRRWLLAATFAVLLAATTAVSLLLPAVYRSQATILIKEQDIPQEMVRSTVTSYADERIQVISQQVLTRATLLDLVDRHGLYGRARQRDTSEEIVDRMRRDIKLATISADITDRRTGAPAKATIAFTLSFESESPASAQKIASELTSLFLNENVKNRQQKAAETTSFLQDELKRVGERISVLEQQLSDFKARNQGRTPDLSLANLMASERAETDLARVDRELAFLSDRQRQLQAQLAETRPQAPLGGGALMEPDDRLRALQLQLTTAQAQFSEDHPDVRRLKREIERLKAGADADAAGGQGSADDREAALRKVEAELSVLRQRYADDHPDVVKLRRTLASLSAVARAAPAAASATTLGVRPAARADNPLYLALKSQIETTTAQLDSLRTERRELLARQAQLGQRVSQAPEVEREQLEMVRELESSRARFRELSDKSMQAQVAEQLERTRKAERFALIEPPVFPERPNRPNRQLIFWMGALLSVAGALGLALLREALSGTVGSPRDVVRLLQVPVLAVLPPLERPVRGRRWLWWSLGLGLLALASLAALGLHLFWMPLDVAWYGLLRRLGI